MLILGIETSCDDTSLALLEIFQEKRKDFPPRINILGEAVSSQVKLHAPFGGIVPTLAAREHLKNLPLLLKEVLAQAREKKGGSSKILEQIDLVAVTIGPGLIPSLLVGVSFAKALAYRFEKKIIGINHLEGHLWSFCLEEKRERIKKHFSFPALALIVSGGHTELVFIKKKGSYKIIGETLDDAAGEAFDKVARLLNLGYPGGPFIEKAAFSGNARRFNFPRPMITSGDYNFSFAGLKTALLYKKKDLEQKGKLEKQTICDLAASFQKAVVDVLLSKTFRAAQEYNAKTIILGGGVVANSALRQAFLEKSRETAKELFAPSKRYSGDNASMVALAAYNRQELNPELAGRVLEQNIDADPNLSL